MPNQSSGRIGSPPESRLKSAVGTIAFATVAWVSLLCPPWQVFVTTSVPLYLNNQGELNHDTYVILPFLTTAIVVATFVLPFYFIALRNRIVACVLWIYYSAGFVFLGVVTIRGWEAGFTAVLLASVGLAIGFVLVQYAANRWWNLRRASAYFAVFALGFAAIDGFEFSSNYLELPDELEFQTADSELPPIREDRPNFYHLVLDEYQTDLFEFVLDEELQKALGGFVWFEDTTTPFGRTSMALAAVFSGRSFDFASPQMDYQLAALTGRQSMLTRLAEAGYLTEGYLHKPSFRLAAPFHRIRYHQTPPYFRSGSSGLFRDMWVYANLPASLSERLMASDMFANFQSQNVLDSTSTVKSVQTLRYLTRHEASEASTGRYVFAHLLLPHFPTVLEADCSYGLDQPTTDVVRQVKCANALLLNFLDTLKNLDRFRDALIVVHADHGARYAVSNGEPKPVTGMREFGDEWNTARSRALLLIKLPGRGPERPLETRSDPASLLDVFPTVAASLGLNAEATEGVDLFDPHAAAMLSERQRWYYFFTKKERWGWTDEMVRFRVEPGRVVRDGVETLRNNPRQAVP